jgi:hypothetical protein
MMHKLLAASIGAATFVGAFVVEVPEANAAVCAAGPYRAGCAGARGAAVVRRPIAPARVCRSVRVPGGWATRCY